MEDRFLTTGEVSKRLQVSESTLRNWNKIGKLTPHHTSLNGYKYYLETQIQNFLLEREARLTTKHNGIKKSKISKKNEVPTKEKPLFKLYVDEGDGKIWVNYYAMRSGKTNSFAFAGNSKLFKHVTENISGQEFFTEDDEYVFREPMHDVTITLDGKYLDSVSAAIAKGVLWIQLAFTNALGTSHPSDDIIEKARYMKWDINDYMETCGLVDRKSAIESIRRILTMLSHAEIQWQEEIVVRDDNGQPVYAGSYRDKNGKLHPKVKKTLQTYRGAFISTRGLKPLNGKFEYWINKEFATYLAHAGVIAVHEKVFQLSTQRNANALTLSYKLQEYYSMNKGKTQAGIISVKTLLNAMPYIPKYEDLTVTRDVRKGDGSIKSYEKHGDKGGWRSRILEPFEEALSALVDAGILKSWKYRDDVIPECYEIFSNLYVCFKFNIQAQRLILSESEI